MVTWFLVKWHAGKPQQDVPTLSTLTIVIVSASNDIVCPLPPSPPGSYWLRREWHLLAHVDGPEVPTGIPCGDVWVPKWRADISVVSSAIHSPESVTCASHLARWVHENTDYLETGSMGCCRQTEWITKHFFLNGRFFGSRNAES